MITLQATVLMNLDMLHRDHNVSVQDTSRNKNEVQVLFETEPPRANEKEETKFFVCT